MTSVAVARCVEVQEFMQYSNDVIPTSSSEKVSERMIDDIDPEWLMLPGRGSNKVSHHPRWSLRQL